MGKNQLGFEKILFFRYRKREGLIRKITIDDIELNPNGLTTRMYQTIKNISTSFAFYVFLKPEITQELFRVFRGLKLKFVYF